MGILSAIGGFRNRYLVQSEVFGYNKQTDCISASKNGILLVAVTLYTKR